MKLNVILASVGIAIFIMGVDQALRYGIGESYWIFMLAGFVLLFSQLIAKPKEVSTQKYMHASDAKKSSPSSKSKKRKKKK